MWKWYICLFSLSQLFGLDPQIALQRLIEGNQRYVEDRLEHPDRTSARREELQNKQHPFAAILGCSDSRVSPEIIFDQGLGDLFVVRVAGNVMGMSEKDSVDYAIKYLGASLVVVMGHESCGAVTAVFDGTTKDIEEVARLIKPGIKKAKNVDAAIKDNVRFVVNELKKTSFIKRLIDAKEINVVGVYYHLGSGNVEIIP